MGIFFLFLMDFRFEHFLRLVSLRWSKSLISRWLRLRDISLLLQWHSLLSRFPSSLNGRLRSQWFRDHQIFHVDGGARRSLSFGLTNRYTLRGRLLLPQAIFSFGVGAMGTCSDSSSA